MAPTPAKPASPLRKAAFALVAMLVILAGVWWWWSNRPAPPYKVQDPGIYPFQGASVNGKTAKWGFIDADGKIVIQPDWDGVAWGVIGGQPVVFNEGLCGVQKDGKWGYIDTSGHLAVPNQFDSAAPFIEGLARVKLGNQFGYIDKTGRYAINPQFDQAGDFHGGFAAVHSNGAVASNPLLGLGRTPGAPADGGWGLINKAGNYVVQAQFPSADANGLSDGLMGVCQSKCGYIDRSGAFVVKPQFDSVSTFSEGLAAVQINSKWGYINTAGRIVINPQFDQVSLFSGGLAAVTTSGHAGTIDKEGKYVVNPGQYNIVPGDGDIQRVVSSDGVGLINRNGTWVVKPSKALTGIGGIFGKVFYGIINAQLVPISISGKVLTGPYEGSMLDSLALDIQNESSSLNSVRTLISAEARYSAAFPATGFTASISTLGPAAILEPAAITPDENHAGFIDADLATGVKDGYQFAISIPAGTSTGGANFNYFLVAKPAAGHAGRTFCADSSGAVRYAVQGEECTITSPTL
ncbi:MAG TPA: WG repeat-containing protein [Terracidiphilus sp.]|nr:WG repeat-containing protein [Terracidiphilus sp.]